MVSATALALWWGAGGGPTYPAPPPTPTGIVQTLNGYTVTIQPGEADGNRLVLTATVRGPWFNATRRTSPGPRTAGSRAIRPG